MNNPLDLYSNPDEDFTVGGEVVDPESMPTDDEKRLLRSELGPEWVAIGVQASGDVEDFMQTLRTPSEIKNFLPTTLYTPIAKKFNESHDELGRFASGDGGGTPSALAQTLVSDATQNEGRITAALQNEVTTIDHGAKLEGLKNRIKKPDSLNRKITNDVKDLGLTPEQAAARMNDVLRYTASIPVENYAHAAQQIVDSLKAQGIESVRLKNFWGTAGYKGANAVFSDMTSGQKFELQFHTPESLTTKSVSHDLYEVLRTVPLDSPKGQSYQKQINSVWESLPIPTGATLLHKAVPMGTQYYAVQDEQGNVLSVLRLTTNTKGLATALERVSPSSHGAWVDAHTALEKLYTDPFIVELTGGAIHTTLLHMGVSDVR